MPWTDVLRWLVSVMDPDPPCYLAFVASCLRWALEHDGTLTEKQHAGCQRVYGYVRGRWDEGTLACQLADQAQRETVRRLLEDPEVKS